MATELTAPDSEVVEIEPPRRTNRLPDWVLAALATIPAVLVTVALFIWMIVRSQNGANTAGLQMPPMDLQNRVGYWWPFLMGETLGLAALLWSYLSVVIGLTFSSSSPRWGLNRRQLNALHRYISMTGLALIAGHVVFVALGSMDDAMTTRQTDWATALLPFQASWNAQFYNVGVFAFYLAIVLGPTYYARRWIGERAWRIIHRASLAVYILAVWHSFGFDDFNFHGPYRWALWIAQVPLVGLLLWRLWSPAASLRNRRRTAPLRLVLGLVALGVLVWLIIVLVTGGIGGGPAPTKV